MFPVWGVENGDATAQCACPDGDECSSPGKHPIPKNWQGEATTKLPQLEAWAKRYTGCNFGMRTDDLIVVDVDPRSGGSLIKLMDEAPNLPVTAWKVETGGGGWHLGFLPPERMQVKGGNGALGRGLDLKARGGFVVCVGSVHLSGQSYRWESGAPPTLSDVPSWVDPRPTRDRTQPDTSGGRSGVSVSPSDPPLRLTTPLRSTLVGLLSAPPEVGERNEWLTQIAGHIYRHFPHEDGAESLVRALNDLMNSPLEESEVQKIMSSVGTTDTEARDARFMEAVAKRAWTMRVQEEARREVTRTSWREPEPTLKGDEYLQIQDEDEPWTIVDLLNAGGNALLAAQFKVGKTTLLLNLMRSLCDGRPFLGRFPVNLEPNARVGFWNYEMPPGQFRRWIRKLNIVRPDRFAVADLRGFDVKLGRPEGNDWAVEWLKQWNVQAWIVDPYARAYSGESENDNTEVSRFTDSLDQVKERAGVDICILGAHFGRATFETGTEHVRGATRLDDWADSRWIQTRDLDGDRFFSAIGRDVDVEESRLSFNPRTLSLNLIEGNRAKRSLDRIEQDIMAYVGGVCRQFADDPSGLRAGLTGRAIKAVVGGNKGAADRAILSLEQGGTLERVHGSGNRYYHVPPEYVAIVQES